MEYQDLVKKVENKETSGITLGDLQKEIKSRMKEYYMLLLLDEEDHNSQDLVIEDDTVEGQGEELPQKASITFDKFFDLCDHCFGKELPQYMETSMGELADRFVSGFASVENLETYKQLLQYGLSHIVGLLKLSKMGVHYGKNKLPYKDQ
eukprot:2070611-Ditylum_brightwellii.AAC.1